MRKNVLVLLGVIVSIPLLLGVGALIAADCPDEISIHSKAFETHKKGPVNLSHKKHNVDYKIACTECHHVYEGGKNVYKEGDPVQACSECHDPVKSEGNVKKLMLAYHKNCQGCHKDLEAAGKPTGPTKKCNDCHAKK
ncbi:MAG: cytochrome c3 family protein [Deltaproteobacteria bacterium]|nr:MAG: cytochrome c3 family protein [Deltaproteobacteria bacterium]